MIDGKTKLYGITGNPVTHSLSPAMHNAAFAELNVNGVYVPFPVEDVAAALTGLKALGVAGVSVTIPHKQAVIPFLDEIDQVAERIGAVNTIAVTGRGEERRLYGSNTDWIGANKALQQKISLEGRRAAVIGAGGAARAIGFGLIEAGAEPVLYNRTVSRGEALAEALGCEFHTLAEIGTKGEEILINSTSVGMSPDDGVSPVAKEVLAGFDVVMDIVYAPLETKLLREAAAAGCACINGLEMLLYQGVAQFELWTGLEAPVATMREALMNASGN